MKYLAFIIEDYKGVKKTEIDLIGKMEPGIYTLVGLNESGKTTLLDAVKFLRDGTDTSSLTASGLIPRRKRISFTGEVKVSAKLKLEEEDKKLLENIVLSFPYKNVSIPGDELTFTRSYHYKKSKFLGESLDIDMPIFASKKKSNKEANELIPDEHPDLFEDLYKTISDKLPSVVYYSDFLYDFPSKIYIDDIGAVKPIDKFYKSVFSDVLSSLDVDLTLDELASRIKSPKKEDKSQVNSAISQMQNKITRDVFGKWAEIFGTQRPDKSIQLIVDVEEGEEGESARAYIEVSLVDGPDDFLIKERSLGFKWFFSFLLLTIFRKSREESDEVLYLLDEPASNLHPTAQKKILETIRALGEDSSKLIYTTHSHFLINPKWLEGAFIIKNKSLDSEDPMYSEGQATEIEAIKYRQFAANNPNQKEYFQPILDTLDYQPSNLEAVGPLIVTEGKFDYYTLRYMMEHYFPEFNYLNIYPGGGAGSNSSAIALYMSWSKDFCILLDADEAGERARGSYLNRFGETFLENKCISYSDVDNSWTGKTMEKLFNPGDLLKIQKELYSDVDTYDKSYFNESVQKLLIDNKKVVLGVNTVNRFKKVFEKISEILPANN